MSPSLSDLSADIDALYDLPLADFTGARNALATRVRAEQGKEAAAGIKALEKPGVSAWVVNRLFWGHRADFDRLLRAGDELRAVQQKRLAGREADIAAALEARRGTLSALMTRATELLRDSGSTSADIRQRVETTLEALSVYGTSDAAPRAGRLTGDVQPPGFAALAALVPAGQGPARGGGGAASGTTASSGRAGLRAVPKPPPKSEDEAEAAAAPPARPVESKRAEKAKAALAQAEEELEQARAEEQEAAAAQTKAQAAWDAAREALDAVQRQLDDAMDRERAAQLHRDAARKAATQASHATGRAERARNEAERYWQSLTRG